MTRVAAHRATVTGDDGPWLVLAHGLGGSPSDWDPVVAAFRGRHRVLTFAQAGSAEADPEVFSRLVLINSSPRYVDDPDTGYHGGLSREALESLLDSATVDYDAWAGGFGEMVMGNPGQPRYAADFVRTLRRLDPQVAVVAFRTAFSVDFRAVLPRIGVPTLILQSTDDPAVPMDVARRMATRIPAARLVELPSTGHFPRAVDPDGVIDAIGGFVAGGR